MYLSIKLAQIFSTLYKLTQLVVASRQKGPTTHPEIPEQQQHKELSVCEGGGGVIENLV